MKIYTYLFIISLLGLTTMVCQSISGEPLLEIGMKKSDVSKRYTFISDKLFWVEPSQISEGHTIRINENIEITIVFDSKQCISDIFTSSELFRLPNGIGINSSFAEIKQQYKNYDIIISNGYGKYVKVDGGIRFGFLWKENGKNNIIGDDEKIKWIEFEKFMASFILPLK